MATEEQKPVGFQQQFSQDINGVHTEFVFHKFVNKWMLLITQLGKLPALYNVTFDVDKVSRTLTHVHGPVEHPEFHVSVPITMECCLGLDTDELRGAIQFLVNKTELNKCSTALMIGLGLKHFDGHNLRPIAEVLTQMVL